MLEKFDLKIPDKIKVTDPLSYLEFLQLEKNARLILTDSGGIQEEAPALNLPVLVMRKITERPEGVDSGCSILVGVSEDSIVTGVEELLINPQKHQAMSNAVNPFGDGHAADKIIQLL